MTQVVSLLNGEKVDAVICVAGGWAGGNAASKGDHEFLILNIFHAVIRLYVFNTNYCKGINIFTCAVGWYYIYTMCLACLIAMLVSYH